MKLWSFFLFFFSFSALANLHLAPPDFDVNGERAIFVDFSKAEYDIVYNVLLKKINVKSRISFYSNKKGNPVFDLVPKGKNVKINGQSVTISQINSPNGSILQKVDLEIDPGFHVLELENSFSKNVRFNLLKRTVSSAFWIRDLKERKFLEQYIPSNFEFDQYKIILNLTFAGIKKAKQDFYTNGELKKISENSFQITFPEYFTVSCPYFHTTPRGAKKRIDFYYKSIDGRDLPVTVYTSWWSHPKKFMDETIKIFNELEKDYGPWGHNGFVAYETLPGTGGMEHAGATQTSLGALDHEMLHSYFAKGVLPANGNAGWIDEAIASWRDYGYQRKPLPDFGGSNLGLGSVYQRNTDSRAYALGREFMAYLDYKLQDVGGLKAFLRAYFKAYNHTVITQEHFKNNLEFFSGIDLTEAFETYIWGKNDVPKISEESHIHRPISDAEMMKML